MKRVSSVKTRSGLQYWIWKKVSYENLWKEPCCTMKWRKNKECKGGILSQQIYMDFLHISWLKRNIVYNKC